MAMLIVCLAASLLGACMPRRIGWVEPVCVDGLDQPLLAKLDTGADRTSIDAQALQPFDRDGKVWLRFRVGGPAGPLLERAQQGGVRVRQESGVSLERPIVRMVLRVDGQTVPVEASLADRSSFDYPLLLGRDVLRGRFLVDSARRGGTTLDCDSRSR